MLHLLRVPTKAGAHRRRNGPFRATLKDGRLHPAAPPKGGRVSGEDRTGRDKKESFLREKSRHLARWRLVEIRVSKNGPFRTTARFEQRPVSSNGPFRTTARFKKRPRSTLLFGPFSETATPQERWLVGLAGLASLR